MFNFRPVKNSHVFVTSVFEFFTCVTNRCEFVTRVTVCSERTRFTKHYNWPCQFAKKKKKKKSNLDSRYPSMPEPTGGLGAPLSLTPQAY